MKRRPFFLTAHPLRALAEAGLLGIVVMLWFSWLREIQPEVLGTGLFFLCGVSGIWAVLRARVPGGSRARQITYELGAATLLSAEMVLLGGTAWFSRVVAALAGPGPAASLTSLVLACTGIGYLVCRGAVRVWLAWDRLRRRRMRWALTHAHLMLVVLAAAGGALALFAITPPGRASGLADGETQGLLASVIARFLLTVFPALSLIVVLTAMALAIILPPSALFSYLIAKQTTRRLEALARGTAALRNGDYGARVAVAGEDELAQLQADFNAMAETLQRTLGDLENERDNVARLLRARRELVASVSHELRTPVATVRATLDSLLGHWPAGGPAEARQDLELVESEVLRLQGLIDDLFTLSRAEVDALRLEVGPVDAGPALQQMVAALAPLAWQSGRVELLAQAPPDLPPVLADGERLKQVIANLLRNAVCYTSPGGIVVAEAAVEGNWLRISVRDTGPGIAPAELPHIWSRFYRGAAAGQSPAAQPAGGRQDGAGLGLALVKELTEGMGGRVAVESVVGQGSCFSVRLPTVTAR